MNMYMAAFATIIILSLSMINLSSYKFNIKEVVGMIFISQCFSIIMLLMKLNEFITMIPLVLTISIFIYLKNKNIVETLVVLISSVIIYILTDYIITNIFILIFGIGPDTIRRNNILYFFLYILDLLIILYISKFLGILVNKKLQFPKLYFNKKFSIIAIISLVLTIIIFYTNIIFENNSDFKLDFIKVNQILFIFYFIILILTLYILSISITKELNLKNYQIQLENLQEYTSSLEKMYTDMRSFRHDYINIISSLIGYIQNRDIYGLEKYFNNHIIPLSKLIETNNFKIDALKNVKIIEIKGILSSKLIKSQEFGCDIYIDIVEPIEKINMDIIDLSRVIGILLDNAFESAIQCTNPVIKLGIINKENSVLIIIINTINQEVPLYKIYKKGFSTKGENRGLGLYNLKKIIDKYNNIYIDTLLENGEFKQVIQIEKEIINV